MNIEFPVPGAFKTEIRDDGIEIWTLSVPIFFTEISTVKSPAVLDCNLRSCRLADDRSGFRLGRTEVRAYLGMNESPLIEARPIVLKDQEGDRNPLSLEFKVAPPTELKIKGDVVNLEMVVRLTFGSMTSIDILLSLDVERELGTLQIREWRRRYTPRPMLRNLGIFAFSITLVGVWNFVLNRDVHGRPSFLEPSVVSLALGAALAFFGLSFSRIQSWFTTLSNFSGLTKWPEIHLDTSAGRLFAQSWVSTPLLVLATLSSLFTLFNYPQTLPELPPGYAVVDPGGTTVKTPEVYLRHLVMGEFRLVCAGSLNSEALESMGSLRPGWRTASLSAKRFKVSYPPYLASIDEPPLDASPSDGPITIPVSGLDLLEFDLDRQENVLAPLLCGGDPKPPLELEVRWSDSATEGTRGIEVVPRPPLELAILRRKLHRFRQETLRNLEEPDDLWLQRDRLAADLMKELQTTNRWLEPGTVVQALEALVEEVDVRVPNGKVRIINIEQALERTILAQGVLQFYDSKRRGRLERSHVESIVTKVTERFSEIDWPHSDRRATRAVWEVLLRVEDLTTGSEPLFHNAIVQMFTSGNADAIVQYLASCVRLRVLDSERGLQARANYFGQSWGHLSQLEGVAGLEDLANYVLRMERFPENLNPEAVHRWLLSLFIPRAQSA